MMDMNRCCADVADYGQSVSLHQCTRVGVLTYKKSRYCRQHYPPFVKEARQVRQAKWIAEAEKETSDLERKAAAYDRLMARLDVGEPKLGTCWKIRAILEGRDGD